MSRSAVSCSNSALSISARRFKIAAFAATLSRNSINARITYTRDRTVAAENVGRVKRTVFGKRPRPVSLTSALFRCGRKLRPHG
jgi:hypothetical protein